LDKSVITRAVTVAAGRFAPGHLGELTQQVPFEMVDAVLEQTCRLQVPACSDDLERVTSLLTRPPPAAASLTMAMVVLPRHDAARPLPGLAPPRPPAACSRIVPFPSQTRSPAASSRSSPLGNRNATLSTRCAPPGPVTGAVHEHWPPGSNGSPTRSDHRLARPATIPGRPAIHSATA
jgi:hypothetical protein